MTGNLKLLINFVWKFLGTARFGNDHVAGILSYGDIQMGKYIDHQDLEVAFRRNTCFVRNLEGVDLLKRNRTTNLYTINLHDMASASPIFLMAHATSTKSWLWHQRLSHLNFDTINDLARNNLVTGLPKFKYHKEHICPSYEQGKSKKASHPPKPVPRMTVRTFGSLVQKVILASSLVIRLLPVLTDSGLDLTYAPSTITTQQLIECELDLLFEAMYDDYIGADTAPKPTNSSSQATNFPKTSQDVNELETQQQHVQQQNNQAPLQPETVADNVPNVMLDENTFVNSFATPSTSVAESSSSHTILSLVSQRLDASEWAEPNTDSHLEGKLSEART
ncbi:retrovirus-related pol polyprotein from transposon TNT 1-94 [Tanacetum coccineum]